MTARRPRLSDLRESGEIEECADNVALIHKGKDDGLRTCETQFYVAKQRQGETGDARVLYRKDTMEYVAYSLEAEPKPVRAEVSS